MAELSDLKSNIGRDMETLHNNQQQLGTAYSALARPTTDSVPSFINTDSSTVVTQSQQGCSMRIVERGRQISTQPLLRNLVFPPEATNLLYDLHVHCRF
jgi:hypothetical protein